MELVRVSRFTAIKHTEMSKTTKGDNEAYVLKGLYNFYIDRHNS